MPEPSPIETTPDATWPDPPRAEPIRRRTLVLLRWAAVAGQLVAVAVALALGVRFPLLPVLVLVALAVGLNLWLMARLPYRMSPSHVAMQLGFDLAQIAALLAMTGGISNPFALLVLAPVTVAATVLSRRQTITLGLATAALISAAALWAIPLRDAAGAALRLPPLLAAGHWAAVLIGIGFFASYAHRVTAELAATTAALFATQLALAREQRLQHLGGVVAAAAHEMGSPLATIKLIAGELADELEDRPELAEDIAQLRVSADRCAQILRSMGQAGKDDLWMRRAPLRAIIEEAAAPHAGRGVEVTISGEGPEIHRDPGVIHALRNLIQNAVDYANGRVAIHMETGATLLTLSIRDDGPGFPPALLPRLGEAHPSGRGPRAARKAEEGMGLGLFIAKTLLERSGADLGFSNGGPGAVVTLRWPRSRIEADSHAALGHNPAFIA